MIGTRTRATPQAIPPSHPPRPSLPPARDAGASGAVACPRCGAECERLAVAGASPVCRPCFAELDALARERQERAELAAWLSTRADPRTGAPAPDMTAHDRRQVSRLVRVARAAGIAWGDPSSYARRRASDYLAELLAPYRPGGQRPTRGGDHQRRAPKHTHTRERGKGAPNGR